MPQEASLSQQIAESAYLVDVAGRAECHPIISREQWLELRTADVTASDIGAICGVDRYRTALRVWAEKTGLISPTADNPTFKRGRWLEAAVIEALREERPAWDVRRAGVYLRDPDIRLGATPDAVAIDPDRFGIGVVQCKTVRRDVFERDWSVGPSGEAAAPLSYQLQTLTEAMLVGAEWACVAALVIDAGGGVELVCAPVHRHPPAEDRIRETVARFWLDLEAGRQPAVDPNRDGRVIEALFPRSAVGQVVDLSSDYRLANLLAKRARRKSLVKAAEAQIEAIDTELKAKLGSAEIATLPGWRVTWKTQRRDERVTPAWEGRVLRITQAKN
jgi:predicted phage-related endonuclease